MRELAGEPRTQRVVHLSDIHLGAGPDQEASILRPLVKTLAELRATWDTEPALLAITGDLHDTTDVDVGQATERLLTLVDDVRAALGGDVPTVIVPGNHDRRTQGLLRPFNTSLMDALHQARRPRMIVGGRELPFLAELVDDAFHALPFAVALIDSSYTPTGLVSAGGLLRVEDVLELADDLALRKTDPSRPLLLLTHHHLVPTPVTDTSRIDADTKSAVLRWLATNVLSGIVSYADHEEWMMTALGAGSLLTSLGALGRPVFVLHGHKHYPAVRALSASLAGQGDVVLLACGSTGLALALDDGDEEDVAKLWPSFHVLDVTGGDVKVTTVAFFGDAPPATRALLHVSADGPGWRVHPVDDRIAHHSARLALNASDFQLRPCAGREDALWDVLATRVVRGEGALTYREHLRALPGARFLRRGSDARGSVDPATRAIELPTDGSPFAYTLVGGAARTVAEALRVYGPTDPYEGVELLCRYETDLARLTLRGLPAGTKAFGSTVDLTRGRTMPYPLVRHDDGSLEVVLEDCPPRTQLRIQWRPVTGPRG